MNDLALVASASEAARAAVAMLERAVARGDLATPFSAPGQLWHALNCLRAFTSRQLAGVYRGTQGYQRRFAKLAKRVAAELAQLDAVAAGPVNHLDERLGLITGPPPEQAAAIEELRMAAKKVAGLVRRAPHPSNVDARRNTFDDTALYLHTQGVTAATIVDIVLNAPVDWVVPPLFDEDIEEYTTDRDYDGDGRRRLDQRVRRCITDAGKRHGVKFARGGDRRSGRRPR